MNDTMLKFVRKGGAEQCWRVKLSRRDTEDGTAPEWKPAQAEYDERSYCGDGLFMAEEYKMQLLERKDNA